MEYLKKLLKIDKFDQIPKWEPFFKQYSNKLKEKNSKSFEKFLKESEIKYTNRDQFTDEINRMVYQVEKNIQKDLFIKNFSTVDAIEKIFLFANCYVDFYNGIFLKEEAAKRMVMDNPLINIKNEVGEELYNHYVDTNPMLLMAIGRFSESENWNTTLLSHISDLMISDFELREPDFIIIDHKIFPETSKKIIDKKCFNTHDKLLGLHIASTLDENFLLDGKAPILRTVTKILHYHKEISIVNKAFREIQKKYPDLFIPKIREMMEHHIYDEDAPLFNTNDLVEGLSNRYIDKQIQLMVEDYPDLKIWADIHDITHIIDSEIVSLSLWRVTSWYLYGSKEHTVQMYRDNILASILIEAYNEKIVEDGTVFSLWDRGNNVADSMKRLIYYKKFRTIKQISYKEAVLVHHNDADGISAGYIIDKTLESKGCKVYRYSLEMMFPEAIEIILKNYPDKPIFIVDLGTEIVEKMLKLDVKQDVFIIDHHKFTPIQLPANYHIFNPRGFGLDADYEGASSVNSYLFSMFALDSYRYSAIGLMGAIGDGMRRRNGFFKGIDVFPFGGAIQDKHIYIKNNTLYYNHEKPINFEDFIENYIDVLGSAGYQKEGVQLAFDLIDKKISLNDERVLDILKLKDKKYREVIRYFKQNGFKSTKNIQLFNVKEMFDPMGVKQIGSFLTYLIENSDSLPLKLNQNRYFIGVQYTKDLYGVGPNTLKDACKVSLRVGKGIVSKIESGDMPNFFEIMTSFEHIPGGVHAMSAAFIVPIDKLDATIEKIDDFISDFVES